jgi:acetate kinase
LLGTRSGDLDPAVLDFICKKENIDVTEMVNILNKKSGLLGLSKGLSSDFRDLNEAREQGNEDAKRAVDCLCYRIIKYIGSYVAAMNGVDAIVFTGGIGENAIPVREAVVKSLGYLGITLDEEANQTRGENKIISTPDSKVTVAIVPTNEELAICQETAELVSK